MKSNSPSKRLALAVLVVLAWAVVGNAQEKIDVSKLEPVELNWYYDGPGPQKDVALIEAAMNNIIQPKINATIKLHALDWGSYDQKVQVLLAAGEPVDLLFSCSWALQYNNAIAKGWLRDLTPMMDKYAPETKKLFAESKWLENIAIDGKVYNLPAFKEAASTSGIIYSKDMAKKFGLDMSKVKSVKDLEAIFKIVKAKDPTVIPFEMSGGLTIYHAGLAWDVRLQDNVSWLISLDPKTSTWQLASKDPVYRDYLTIASKFYKAGYINQDAATAKDYTAPVKSGKVFSYPVQLKPGKDGEETKALGINLAQIQLSKIVATQGDLTNSMMAIPTNSKNPERALMFYNLMYTDPELINTMDYGIEGTHYVFVDKAKKIIDFPASAEGGSKSGWNHGTNWMFGNQMLSYIFKGEDPEKWNQFLAFNRASERGQDFGFSFDAEPVKKEVAALKNVEDQYRNPLMTGLMDPVTYLAQWESKAKAAGIDKILAEMNKQYAVFKAAKKK